MARKSFDSCPWCSSDIELAKNPKGLFECSLCHCEFRHNFKKWIVAIPIGFILIVTALKGAQFIPVLKFVPPIALAGIGFGITGILVSRMTHYLISKQGPEVPPEPTQSQAFQAQVAKEESNELHGKKLWLAWLICGGIVLLIFGSLFYFVS